MKSNLFLTIITVFVLLLSACSTKAVPTVDPALVQASAVAAASTMLAMTQDAMPTATPIPPTVAATDTPQPTPTIPLLPTNPVLPSPTTVTSSSAGGECGGPIKASKGENLATIVINNRTNVLLGVSLYLAKNTWGDCGFWSSPAGIPANSSTSVSLPASNSCYHVTAWTLAGKPNFMNFGAFCTASLPARYTVNVTTASISLP